MVPYNHIEEGYQVVRFEGGLFNQNYSLKELVKIEYVKLGKKGNKLKMFSNPKNLFPLLDPLRCFTWIYLVMHFLWAILFK